MTCGDPISRRTELPDLVTPNENEEQSFFEPCNLFLKRGIGIEAGHNVSEAQASMHPGLTDSRIGPLWNRLVLIP